MSHDLLRKCLNKKIICNFKMKMKIFKYYFKVNCVSDVFLLFIGQAYQEGRNHREVWYPIWCFP